MNDYKLKLKKRNNIAIVLCIIFAVLYLFSVLLPILQHFIPDLRLIKTNTIHRPFAHGCLLGILTTLTVGIINRKKAIRDEEKLKTLYITENDERLIHIKKLSAESTLRFYLILGWLTALVVGYFNSTISYTIFACLLAFLLINSVVTFYYKKKF